MILPVIPACSVHRMLNVPFVLNVRVTVEFVVTGMSVTPEPEPNRTSCAMAVKTNVTTPPAATVTACGSNDVSGMLICADVGAGPAPPPETFATAMVRVALNPPDVAVTIALPTDTPVITPADDPTVSTDVFDEVHENVAGTVLPDALRAEASSVAEAPTTTEVVLPPIDTLAMTVLLVLAFPGEVGELPPPPPQALIPGIRATASSSRVRPDLGGMV